MSKDERIIHVVAALGGPWRAIFIARVIPARLRDALYRVVARHRYRWFGRRQVCYLPGGME